MNKVLENIAHKMVFTCEKATFLIEKKASGQSISILENMRLKGHLALCKWCRAYNKKVAIIDNAILRISKKANEKMVETEIKDFKNYLIDKTFQ